jgi:hypothetical protein
MLLLGTNNNKASYQQSVIFLVQPEELLTEYVTVCHQSFLLF